MSLPSARRDLAAARTLLASGLPDLALPHLDAAEKIFSAQASTSPLSPSPSPSPSSLPASPSPSPLPPPPSPSPLAPSPSPSPRRRLRRLERTVRAHTLAATVPRPFPRRLLRRAPILIPLAFALTLAAAHGLWHLRTGARPWRASYWDNPSLSGEPTLLRHHDDLHLAWGAGSPGLEIRRDGFSARIETCLSIDDATRAAFLLIAQDDARLFIDGAPVIDNSGEHRRRVRGAEIDLPAGRHHLRVDYRHLTGGASVTLLGSLDGRAPAPLPASRLIVPVDDPSLPCP